MNTSLSGASVAPAPTGPQYALLDARLDGIKVTATINGRWTTVWGTLVGGERKIVYSVKKAIHVPNTEHVMIVHPGLLRAKRPWVVISLWGASWNGSQSHWMAKGACWRL